MQNLWLVYVLGAALTWGAYGPALHKGRAAFPDAPTASLRALVCGTLGCLLSRPRR